MLKRLLFAALAGSAAAFVTPQPGALRPCGSAVAAHCAAGKHRRLAVARGGVTALRAQDDLDGMFAGALKFDLELSDNENLAIATTKCEKITESDPAWALFGDDKMDTIQRVGVKIVKCPPKQNSVFIGVCKMPRSPSRPCFADTIRTPACMVEKGGSVYRTGRIGTKLVEYLGDDAKKMMGDSYPPKFAEGDVVKMELNKASGEWKCWVNDKNPLTITGVAANSKFFVNAEAKDSQFEIMSLD